MLKEENAELKEAKDRETAELRRDNEAKDRAIAELRRALNSAREETRSAERAVSALILRGDKGKSFKTFSMNFRSCSSIKERTKNCECPHLTAQREQSERRREESERRREQLERTLLESSGLSDFDESIFDNVSEAGDDAR